MTTDAKRVFVDTNILASALLPEAPRYFHARGILRRLAEADAEVWISRQVIREYLATMTKYEPLWNDVTRATLIDSGRTLERHYCVAEDLPLVAVNCRVPSPSPALQNRSRTMGTKTAFVFRSAGSALNFGHAGKPFRTGFALEVADPVSECGTEQLICTFEQG